MLNDKELKRFNSQIGDCTPWIGTVNNKGYGVVSFARLREGKLLAHRIAYCIANNVSIDDIDEKVVMHRCDNPSCVNPAHLSLGSQKDNVGDMIQKGRGHKQEGELSATAKLTNEDVISIVSLFGKKKHREIAEIFGVNPSAISKIRTGERWNHLTGLKD